MSREIRIAFAVELPDDATQMDKVMTVFAAWKTFSDAVKSVQPTLNDPYLGPARQRRRRRKGKLQVVEPPSAA